MTDEELINAVATEVMGWHKGYGSSPGDAPIWLDHEGKYVGYYVLCKSPYIIDWKKSIKTIMWNPLTNYNHTMMVVNKMIARGFVARFWYEKSEGWHVDFSARCDQSYNRDHNLSLSICKAAIRAIKGKSYVRQ